LLKVALNTQKNENIKSTVSCWQCCLCLWVVHSYLFTSISLLLLLEITFFLTVLLCHRFTLCSISITQGAI
jgi:hypothetical protein